MPRRFRFVALLALLVGATMGLAACGSEEEPSAQDLLKATFGPDQQVDSGNLDVRLAFEGQGLRALQGPIALELTGPFSSNGSGKIPSVDLTLTLSGGGSTFSAGATSDGEKGWVELQGTNYVVDDATFARFREGYEAEAAKGGEEEDEGTSFASLGIDPLRWLRDPRVAGKEEVGGTETHHVTARVDVAAFLEDISELLARAGELGGGATQNVPSSLSEQQRADIAASVKDAVLDVWTGTDDKALRRLTLRVDLDVPANVRKRAGGLTTGRLDFSLAINDLNEDQDIQGPADARPFSELQALLTGAAPAPQGGGTAGEQGGTVPPAADGESSEYLDCIAAAGDDVAKIQECASLAGR